MRKVILAATVCLAFGPAAAMLAVAAVMNPAAQASCLPGAATGLQVGTVPEELVATTSDGISVRLDRRQLGHAATIIRVGGATQGVGQDGVTIALMAALTESSLLMLSNKDAVPRSARFPHDGDGGDHDSLGLFQMRPSTGWGTVTQLMDPAYQARAFFGGSTGPNGGSPRGLLDIPEWQALAKGAAAQAVEVSAHPDRYIRWEPVAAAAVEALTRSTSRGAPAPETGRVVFPLPANTWVRTSDFGMRIHPVTGERKLHTGSDFAATAGTHILAAADGRVVFAGPAAGYGNLILVEHTVGGQQVVSGYAHMDTDGIHVQVDDTVIAGEHIADVGTSGYNTGPHLHFEIRPGGADAPPADPQPWLAGHAATTLETEAPRPGCGNAEAGGPATAYPGENSSQLVDDPTTGGLITQRTAHVLAQVRANFPASSWACWSPRPGTSSEHPLGRACDGTFGNTIGTPATGSALALGWQVTNWLKANAQTLGVEYLIWQGRIWSLARSAEGWRPYGGGGMHDPGNVTGGHYDHLHLTVAA